MSNKKEIDPPTQAREVVLFPVPKDLVVQLIKTYSNTRACGGCLQFQEKAFTCCSCQQDWNLCSKECGKIVIHNKCNSCKGFICQMCKYTGKYATSYCKTGPSMCSYTSKPIFCNQCAQTIDYCVFCDKKLIYSDTDSTLYHC